MASGTILDMFNPQSAEVIGTMRTARIADEPFDTQIRNAGMSVLDAMLSTARDRVVELASGTAIGQNLIQTAQAQQTEQVMAKWAPLIIIGVLVMVFMVGRSFSRS